MQADGILETLAEYITGGKYMYHVHTRCMS